MEDNGKGISISILLVNAVLSTMLVHNLLS